MAKAWLPALLVAMTQRTLELDLLEVDFIDASGVSALLSTKQQLEASGSALVITSASRKALRVIRLLRLEDLVGGLLPERPERRDGTRPT